MYEELKQTYPIRIETHAHTKPVSACSEIAPAKMVQDYLELGYDAIAITNHFNPDYISMTPQKAVEFYLSDFYETRHIADGTRLRVLLGMEIRFTENSNDYLVFGIDEADIERAHFYLGRGLKAFYEGFHTERNIILQAHPFRDHMTRADAHYLDGIESFNMHPRHNARISLACRWARAEDFIVSAGTDYHHPGDAGMAAVRVKACPTDSFELASLLKSRDYLFDIGGSIVLPY